MTSKSTVRVKGSGWKAPLSLLDADEQPYIAVGTDPMDRSFRAVNGTYRKAGVA